MVVMDRGNINSRPRHIFLPRCYPRPIQCVLTLCDVAVPNYGIVSHPKLGDLASLHQKLKITSYLSPLSVAVSAFYRSGALMLMSGTHAMSVEVLHDGDEANMIRRSASIQACLHRLAPRQIHSTSFGRRRPHRFFIVRI